MASEHANPTEGVVVNKLPNEHFRVRLDSDEHEVLAQISGSLRKHSINILVGDRVRIEISPYDSSKGRIIYRHG